MPPRDGGRSWPPSPSPIYHAQFGRSSLKSVVIDREPQKLGSADSSPKWRRRWRGRDWPPKNKPSPHMCHHVKFRSSASNGVRRNRWKPPKFGSAGTAVGTWLTPRNRPSPRVILSTLVVVDQTVRALSSRSAWKMTLHVPPFKVTQGHRNRHGSIRHLWLNVP